MPALPALRQLVFLAADLDATLAAARHQLGLGAGVTDEEGMAALGFVHEVLTIDQTYLEFTAPSGPDTMPGRLVAKRGDLGYMVVLQVADLDEVKQRAAAIGAHPVFETPYDGNVISQWHPRVFGTLLEIDQTDPIDGWHYGPQAQANACTDVVGDIRSIDVAVEQPASVAGRWAALLGIDVAGDGTSLDLAGRTVAFVPVGPAGEGLVAVDLPTTDPARQGTAVTISGVAFRLVAP